MTRELDKLRKKRDQIITGAETLASAVNDWQMIKEYLNNRLGAIELNPQQKKKLEIYQYIYAQLSSMKLTNVQLVNHLTKPDTFAMCQSEAYQAIAHTHELYGSVMSYNKRFEILMELETAKISRNKAYEVNDFDSVAKLTKIIIDLNQQMPEEDEALAKSFEGHQIIAVFDPRLLGAPDVNMKEILQAINHNRKVNVNIDLFEELEYQEVKDPANDSAAL